MQYPYKKYSGSNKGDYVPKKERSDHNDALTFMEWKSIVQDYYRFLCLYLTKGHTYRFNSKMGALRVKKYKSKKRSPDYNRIINHIMERDNCDRQTAKKNMNADDIELFKHYNLDTDGYRWLLIWTKDSDLFRNMKYWNFKIVKPLWKEMKPLVVQNINKIDLVHTIGTYK